MSFRSSKSSHKRSVSRSDSPVQAQVDATCTVHTRHLCNCRASMSSHNSGNDTTAKLADQLSLNSFSESESPILAAYPR